MTIDVKTDCISKEVVLQLNPDELQEKLVGECKEGGYAGNPLDTLLGFHCPLCKKFHALHRFPVATGDVDRLPTDVFDAQRQTADILEAQRQKLAGLVERIQTRPGLPSDVFE